MSANVDYMQIESAEAAETDWHPQPITTTLEQKEYPLDALPDLVRGAVDYVAAETQAPKPMIAGSALMPLSVIAQGHIDVQRKPGLVGPVSLYMLDNAMSGERKTTVAKIFSKAISEHQSAEFEQSKRELNQYQDELAIYRAEKKGIEAAIQRNAKGGKPNDNERTRLSNLVAPKKPRLPEIVLGDATGEALLAHLAETYPIGYIQLDEAGTFFGGHSAGADSRMRYFSALNDIWSGTPCNVKRKTSGSFQIDNARLCISLMVQPEILQEFFRDSGKTARGIGMLARFLFCYPKTTQGERLIDLEALENDSAPMRKYNKQLKELLERKPRIDDNGSLILTTVPLSDDALKLWVHYNNAVEKNLPSEFNRVRDVACKSADQAARIAACFEYLTIQIVQKYLATQ